MRHFHAVRRAVIDVLPFLAGLVLGSVLILCGLLGYRVLTDWQDFAAIAESNRELLQAMKDDEAERSRIVAEAIAELKAANEAMMAQHDDNDHLRHISGHPRTPVVVTSPIVAPPPRTPTATTRPRTTATTARRTPTTARPAPTTQCERLPNGRCKK